MYKNSEWFARSQSRPSDSAAITDADLASTTTTTTTALENGEG
jgi:hypothetical protein